MEERSYYTIASTAREALHEIGEYSMHRQFQFEEFAMVGYREACMDFAQVVITVLLPMNSLRVVNMPEGFIDWVKVGVQVGDRVQVIGLASDLGRINKQDDCGNYIPNAIHGPLDAQPTGTNLEAYTGYWFNNYNGEQLYGNVFHGYGCQYGLPNQGFFSLEGSAPNKRMRFTGDMANREVYLEYISDGISPCGETYVDPYMFEYLKAFCHYKRVKGRDDYPQSIKQEKERDMLSARNIAQQRIASISPIDIVNSSRKGFKLTSKV